MGIKEFYITVKSEEAEGLDPKFESGPNALEF